MAFGLPERGCSVPLRQRMPPERGDRMIDQICLIQRHGSLACFTSKLLPQIGIVEQAPDRRRKGMRIRDRNHQATFPVVDHIPATGSVGGHDRTTTCRRFNQGLGQTLTIARQCHNSSFAKHIIHVLAVSPPLHNAFAYPLSNSVLVKAGRVIRVECPDESKAAGWVGSLEHARSLNELSYPFIGKEASGEKNKLLIRFYLRWCKPVTIDSGPGDETPSVTCQPAGPSEDFHVFVILKYRPRVGAGGSMSIEPLQYRGGDTAATTARHGRP